MNARINQALTLPAARVDAGFAISVAVLLCVGLVMVGSASVAVADRLTGQPLYFFYRQAVYAVFGLAAAFAVVHVPMRFWQTNSTALLLVGLGLLVVVLLPGIGHDVNGARRWIDMGLFSVQVSEPARLCLLLYLCAYAVRRQYELRTSMAGLLRPMLPVALACLLMLVEPDYGACAVLFAVTGLVLFLAGARLWYLLMLAAGAGTLLMVAALSSPYRLARLVSFTDPWAHPFASGFQLTQSLIAIGRGGVFGVGLGNSIQKLLYLPETKTDFLFAILSEELGLIGAVAVVGLFALAVARGFVIANRALARQDYFNAFTAYAFSAWVGLQAFVNIAVNMGLLPTKGLTLPFMSYGGSSLVIMCLLVAIILRVDLENRAPVKRRGRR